MKKNQAMRLLDRHRIAYEARVYDASGAFHTGAEAATLLGVAPEAVYKTLVVLRDEPSARPLLIVIPVQDELDLKAAARAAGVKRLRMATQRQAESLTRLKVGGISALAVRPGQFDVLLDARALTLASLHVSAGERGVDIALAPADFVAVTGARAVVLTGEGER